MAISTMKGLAAVLVAGLTLPVSPAFARSELYHPFVKDGFYLARGNTPATFEQVASDPLSVFRSQVAYHAFRSHVGDVIGEALDDESFRALFRSERVRLVPCTGMLDTAGVSDSGRLGWRKRACYSGEMNIEVRLPDGRWLKVGSQACWNAVRGEIPHGPISIKEIPPSITYVKSRARQIVVSETPGIIVGGSVFSTGCPCCGKQNIIGTPMVSTPGTSSTTIFFED